MNFNEKQLNFIYTTSKNIILEQPQTLAERITESFKYNQAFKDSEMIRYACQYSFHKLAHSLKSKNFDEHEIKCCTLFISIFTRRIIRMSTQLFERHFYEMSSQPIKMSARLTAIINDVSSTEIKYFENRFNNFLNSYKV
ncbi:hypothetical protein [Lactococcus garvieae]|uniref:hypothetical protein n=1 Tax=Lactococcus garvieae TaxID=1363 RepID=UPI0005B4EBB4|nr:hypothetical protein [Lactococcus garvieae]